MQPLIVGSGIKEKDRGEREMIANTEDLSLSHPPFNFPLLIVKQIPITILMYVISLFLKIIKNGHSK